MGRAEFDLSKIDEVLEHCTLPQVKEAMSLQLSTSLQTAEEKAIPLDPVIAIGREKSALELSAEKNADETARKIGLLALNRLQTVRHGHVDLARLWEIGEDAKSLISDIAFNALEIIQSSLELAIPLEQKCGVNKKTVLLRELKGNLTVVLFYRHKGMTLRDQEKSDVRRLRIKGYELPHVNEEATRAYWDTLIAVNPDKLDSPKLGPELPNYTLLALDRPDNLSSAETFDYDLLNDIKTAYLSKPEP